jgi:hypothetical protein
VDGLTKALQGLPRCQISRKGTRGQTYRGLGQRGFTSRGVWSGGLYIGGIREDKHTGGFGQEGMEGM